MDAGERLLLHVEVRGPAARLSCVSALRQPRLVFLSDKRLSLSTTTVRQSRRTCLTYLHIARSPICNPKNGRGGAGRNKIPFSSQTPSLTSAQEGKSSPELKQWRRTPLSSIQSLHFRLKFTLRASQGVQRTQMSGAAVEDARTPCRCRGTCRTAGKEEIQIHAH